MFRRQIRPIVFSWLSVGLLTAIVVQPLLGLPPKGHDTLLHFYRIPAINALWQHGILFSRWLPDLTFGYGSPLLNFYPPLSPYLLTLSYWVTGANAPVGLNLAFGLALVTASVGMFLLGRDLYGNAGGVFAAAAYTLAPHLLYQTFARGSLSNALAMGLFPLAVLATLRVAQQPTARRVAGAAGAFAAVLLAHTAASLLFAVPLAVMGLAATPSAGSSQVALARRLSRLSYALAGGLALAAFSWLPAVAEIQFTRYETAVAADNVDYTTHFAEIWQWPEQAIAGLSNAPLPKTVGPGQLVLGCLGFGLGLAYLLAWSRDRQQPLARADVLTTCAGFMGLGAVFMATPVSGWVWENVGLIRNLQFPWRWLDVGTFCLALTCGRLACELEHRQWWHIGLLAGGLITFFAAAVPSLYPPRLEQLPKQPTLADATQAQQRYGIYGLTGWGEYTSSAVPDWPAGPPFPGADQGASLDMKLRRTNLPDGALVASEGDPLHATLHMELASDTTVVFDTHYFPGWAATIDGQSTSVGPDEAGRLRLTVPAGTHTVNVYFGRTPVRRVADGLSLLAALAVGLAFMWRGGTRQFGKAAASTFPSVSSQPKRQQVAGLAILCGLLVTLALCKFVWLDHFNSRLVVHPGNNQIPGVSPPMWGDFDGRIRLVGYRVTEPDQLALYWEAQQPLTRAYRIAVALADAQGLPVTTIVNDHPGETLTSAWAVNQLTRDVYELPVDEELRPIGYRLSVAVQDPETDESLTLTDSPDGTTQEVPVGTLKLPPRIPESAAADAQPVGAIFGGAIELSQVSVPATISSGGSLDMSLIWRSLAPVAEDYTVFIHLLHPDGTLVAAYDSQPRDGLYPTSFWSPGEVIIDDRSPTLDVQPGKYLLELGLYRLATGERLPVSGANVSLSDRIIIKEIRVIP